MKSITSEKAANTAIKRGIKQIKENPGGLILDIRNTNYSENLLIEVINKRTNWYKDDIGDIMIVSNNVVVKILRYKK